jgi:hypothetical protein
VHFTEKPEGLATRIKKIADGEYQEEWERILQLSDEELQNTTASIK